MKYAYATLTTIITAVCLSLFVFGCGGDKQESSEKPSYVAEKAAERIIEKSIENGGQKADVKINSESKEISVTIDEGKDAKSSMNISGNGNDMTMNITGNDGAMKMNTGAGAKIPDAFPKDIPLYPEMKLVMVMEMGADGYTVSALSKDPMEDVLSFYQKKCTENGWKEVMNMSQNGDKPTHMINYQKEESVLNVILGVDDEGVSINLTTGKN